MSRRPVLDRLLSGSASQQTTKQFAVMCTIVAITAPLALGGLGAPARIVYVLLSVGAGAWYSRRSPWLFVGFTLWLWTITPLVRRLIDYRGGFDSTNLILATPNIVALFMLRDLVKDRALFRRPEFGLALLFLLPCIYGFGINLVKGQVFAAAVGASDWLIPMLYYFYAIRHASIIKEAEGYFSPFLALNAMVIAGYGLYQFWQPTAWDLAWAQQSGFFGSADRRLDNDYLAFSTLNSTGVNAVWVEVLMILSLHFRTTLMLVMLPALGVELLFTNVRSALVTVIAASLLAAVVGESHTRRSLMGLLAAFIVIGFTVSLFNPAVLDRMTARISTFGALDTDYSAITRAEIIRGTPALIAQHPVGLGIGALGRGAEVSDNNDLVTVDFGPLAIYLSLGWVAGSLYLFGLCAAAAQAFMASRSSRSPAALAFAICAIGLVMALPLVNVFGFVAVPLWLCSGMAAAYAIAGRSGAERPANPVLRTPHRALGGRVVSGQL